MHLLLQSCVTRCTEFLSKRAISPRRILSWVNRDYVKETLGGFLLLYLSLCHPLPLFSPFSQSIRSSSRAPTSPLLARTRGISGVILPVTCIVPLWHAATPFLHLTEPFYTLRAAAHRDVLHNIENEPLARCLHASPYFTRGIPRRFSITFPLFRHKERIVSRT